MKPCSAHRQTPVEVLPGTGNTQQQADGTQYLLNYARAHRGQATDAEALIWRRLRSRQLGVKFRRQHPVAPHILDFYCHEHRLAIELDGGQHYSPEGSFADQIRTQQLEWQGITVLRFSNLEVLQQTDAVLNRIWHALFAPGQFTHQQTNDSLPPAACPKR